MTAPARRYAFVFVCQAGELEIKALLLAASLQRNLRCEYELIAAVPTPASTWGDPAPETRALLERLGVRIEPIVNPLAADYPIGNKLACLGVPTRADKIVFLDSDILCLRDFGAPDCLDVPFAAKPADLRTFAAGAEAWQPLYAAAGVALPSLRLPTTVSGEFGLAYFNSGVIFADAAARVGDAWIACARAIENLPTMRQQRHWLDQVSLAIAVHQRHLRYAGLDERFNFPAHLKPLAAELPFLCHYHWPRIIAREPVLIELVRDLAQSHAPIAQRLRADASWSALLDAPAPKIRSAPASTPRVSGDILIAGMADSGADELLGHLRNAGATIDDEPDDLGPPLAAAPAPWEIAARVAELRRDALAAAAGVGSSARQPAMDAIVGVKSALAFLCRLDAVRRVAPHAHLVVCVRNPFDTIAAWKARPAADFAAQIAWVAAAGDQWLARRDLDDLRRIADLPNAAEQRAGWWWWLAQRVLAHASGVTIVRYGELVADSARVVAHLLAGDTAAVGPACARHLDAGSGTKLEQAPLPGTRLHDTLLDEQDLQAIRAICLQAAADLGVSERGD